MSFYSFKLWHEEENLVYNHNWLMLGSMEFLITLRILNIKAEIENEAVVLIIKPTEFSNHSVHVPCDQLITVSKDGKINSDNARKFIQKILTQSGVPVNIQDKIVKEFACLAEKMTTDARFACCSVLPINIEVEALESVAVMQCDEKCFICSGLVPVGSVAAVMPCDHVYHPDCAVDWFKSYSNCPLCQLVHLA